MIFFGRQSPKGFFPVGLHSLALGICKQLIKTNNANRRESIC
jgi:hypothetical protein